MDVHDLVIDHYSGGDLAAKILDALDRAGVDTASLSAEDLAPVDQLHAGFGPATAHLIEQLAPSPGTRLLDVGCGVGGGARMAATMGAGRVVGIDLTPEFVSTARTLTERVGLGDRFEFEVTPGDVLPYPDSSFDAAMMIHVGMNVPDKQAVFSEIHRVLAPGGRFALFEQMRTAEGDLPYPLPWSDDQQASFVETPDEYAEHLNEAGFTLETTEDRTAAVAGPPPPGPPGSDLSPMVLFGQDFGVRIGNNIAATRAGLLGAILMVARAN